MQWKKLWLASLPVGCLLAGTLLLSETALAYETDASATSTVSIATDTTHIEPAEQGTWTDTSDGKKYIWNDGSFATGEQEVDGIPYLFDYTGILKTGWRTVFGIRRFYHAETGQPQIGWISDRGNRYYVTAETGKMTGEVQLDGIRYWLDSEAGVQQTGFCTFPDATISYYTADGTAVNGWFDTSQGRFYGKNYVLQTGWQNFDGKPYYFQENGKMQTGWLSLSDKRYYFNTDGILQTGWQTIAGKRYYFTTDGTLQTGWQTIAGKRYYFTTDGMLLTGWQTIAGKRYYFATDGILQTGWQTISGKRYYFATDGMLLTGWQTIGKDTYYITEEGCLIGSYNIGGKTYHFGKTGCLTPTVIAWQQDDGAEEQRSKYLIDIAAWQNYVWTVCGEKDQTIGNSACGLFSVINAVYYKTNTFLDPIAMANWAKANGYRTAHSGIAESFFQAYANSYGYAYGFRYAGRMYNVDSALQHVRSGGTICANIPGHWISVVDYDPKTGKYLLLDSAANYPRCTTISSWQSTGAAWVSATEFTQNEAYRFFVGNRKVYAMRY